MRLQLRTFDSIVSSAAAAVQGAAQQVLDLTVGSVLRAVLEANAGLALWMQWLIVQVLQTTRAATSTGADLDSWVADFGLSRLPAVAATGNVTFARFAPITTALIPAGTIVRTGDGSQTFVVNPDPSSSAWNPAQNGFVLQPGVASVSVPVSAQTPGSAGNVQANTISLIGAALPGIDTVNNPVALVGGLDGEDDTSLRNRFATYLGSLSRATPAAIGYAIASVQQGLQYTIQENVTPSGTSQPGCFVVTVDDGSGAPSAALLARIAAAIEVMRPLGSIWTVVPPTVQRVDVAMSITTANASAHPSTAAAVSTAISSFINTLPVGAILPWSRLAQIAYGTSDQISNVQGVTINGGTADIAPGPGGVVKAGSVVVL